METRLKRLREIEAELQRVLVRGADLIAEGRKLLETMSDDRPRTPVTRKSVRPAVKRRR